MRTVLIVSSYFTAEVSIGSIRMRALAKYLPLYGWRPVVLTPAIPWEPALPLDQVDIIETIDLYAPIRRMLGMPIGRLAEGKRQTASPYQQSSGRQSWIPERWFASLLKRVLKDFFAIPDVFVWWYPFAVHTVRRVVLEERRFTVDAVLSSSNPRTPHLIGRRLHDMLDVPWIADLRDFWTLDHYYPYKGVRKAIERRLEKATLSRATTLVTVSRPYAERLRAFLGREDVHVITNGFDPDEWCKVPPPLTKKYTITYTGSLSGGKRDPGLLLEVIRELADEGALDLQDIEIRFFGLREAWLDERAKKLGLEHVVRQYGYLPRDQVLRRQRESHILLILLWNHPLDAGVLTSKLEYLAAQRPILALGGPGGDLERLLNETSAGVYVRGGDKEALRRFLVDSYIEYKTTGSVVYRGRRQVVMKYSHVEMARRFAELLEQVVETKGIKPCG